MLVVIDSVATVLFSIVLFQDFKQRQLSWVLIPLLLLVLIVKGIYLLSVKELINYSLINLGFIVSQLLLLTLYISVKNKKFVFIVNTYLGLGDILFFVVICVAFSPINFVYFYFFGLLFTLITYLIYNLMVKTANKEIPLAGVLALLMILTIIFKFFFHPFNFYDDTYLTSLFIK